MTGAWGRGTAGGGKVTGKREGANGSAIQATLLYDTDCGPCSKFASAVRRLDRKGRIELVSMWDPKVEALWRPRLGSAYDASFHLVMHPSLSVRSGPEALHDLARLLPAVKPLADVVFALPGVRRVPAAVYERMAQERACERGADAE